MMLACNNSYILIILPSYLMYLGLCEITGCCNEGEHTSLSTLPSKTLEFGHMDQLVKTKILKAKSLVFAFPAQQLDGCTLLASISNV